MANIARIDSKDQSYTLELTFNARCDLEERAGKFTDEIVKDALKGSARDLRWIVWAALQQHHANAVKTAEDAGLVIDAVGGTRSMAAQLLTFLASERAAS